MADKHQQIDLTTLREVERLLTSTEFASVDDLASRGFGDLAATPRSSASSTSLAGAEGTTPLPRRR
jgi:hypothetical protein